MKRVLFIGSKHIGLAILKEMHKLCSEKLIGIITLDDSLDSRSVLTELKNFSKKNELSFSIVNRSDFEGTLKSYNPDICFVVGWYWLISEELIDYVPFGFVGIHNSLLPKYRGGAPLVWQVINGEKEVGFSMFSLTPGMDDGMIWAQGKIFINHTEYIDQILCRLGEKTVKVFKEKYLDLLSNKIKPYEQNHLLANYCASRSPSDGIIDWKKPAKTIIDFIRAQSRPYPGAFSYLYGKPFIIWKASLFEPVYFGTPGQIALIKNWEVFVICGDNRAIILEEVEYSDEVNNPAKFITSIKIRL